MKKKLFSLVIFLGVLATFFIGADGCKGKNKDKSSSSTQTASSTQDNAAPSASKK